MAHLSINLTYIGILLALIGRGIGVPIPEDIPLLTAGFLCARHIIELKWMLPLAWVGVMLADCLSFLAGRFFRSQLPRLPVIRLALSPPRIQKAETLYHNHGLKGLLVARFMPGFRTPLFFTAGTAGVPFIKFLLTDMLAATVSVSLLIFLGWYFPMKLEGIQDISDLYKWGILFLIAGSAATVLAINVWRKRK